MENISYAIEANNIHKRFKGFTLELPRFFIPKGFATALIGENGAGKTTLLNILTGIRLDYQGEITYFERYNDKQREKDAAVKNRIGYTGSGSSYYMPGWSVKQVSEVSSLLFPDFDKNAFMDWCEKLDIVEKTDQKKAVSALSEGNKVKLMLAGVLSRKTDLLLLDEPASPLDPLMRETLCEILRDYLTEGAGERSVFFSTHNIADMEQVTDYAIIMEKGQIAEQGFVEELKEKYILVKGEVSAIDQAREILYTIQTSPYGFEGICLAERLDALAGLGVSAETPTLSQISVAVMKQHSRVHIH